MIDRFVLLDNNTQIVDRKAVYLNKYALMLFWPVYFLFFYITERFISYDVCHLVHSSIDDLIPFKEYFVIFYFLWHVLLFCFLFYYFFNDEHVFKQFQLSIICVQVVCVFIYCVYPTIQDLRPSIVPVDFFSNVLYLLYSFDTPTGVCPSQHVTHSVIMAYFAVANKSFGWLFKLFICICCFMVILSVLFIKQHSVIDVVCGVVLSTSILVLVSKLFRIPIFV